MRWAVAFTFASREVWIRYGAFSTKDEAKEFVRYQQSMDSERGIRFRIYAEE